MTKDEAEKILERYAHLHDMLYDEEFLSSMDMVRLEYREARSYLAGYAAGSTKETK
jgi:hypothetical protein